MRVIRPKAAILGDRVLADFARSLQAPDLAAATCRGYAADLGRFRAWVEDGRGEGVALRKIGALDLANYRQHLIRTEKLRAASVQPQSPGAPEILRLGWAQKADPPQSRDRPALPAPPGAPAAQEGRAA